MGNVAAKCASSYTFIHFINICLNFSILFFFVFNLKLMVVLKWITHSYYCIHIMLWHCSEFLYFTPEYMCSARSQLTDQLLSTHLYISAVNKPPSTKQRITTTRFNINLFQTLTKQGYIFLTERTVSAWLVGAAIPLLWDEYVGL